eukprot:GFUD01008750.1.p1 GENE.GFUD01008750.1~~GFUD01008750.1.p1  ORF type:complete len:205 (+),score=71.80 GFUD01008750.1:421-1035(+)
MSLGLLGAYLSDSDSDSEDGEDHGGEGEGDHEQAGQDKTVVRETLANPFLSRGTGSGRNWLPKPSFMQETEKVSGVKFDNSVFSNPFRAKEDKKEAILEQHVEMTLKQEAGRTINGKKVCWNFRKGRCRHGHKCSFAHDSDVKSSVVESLYSPKYDSGAQVSCEKANTRTVQPLAMVVRKKRPGLSDGIQPSKKAMKFHKQVYN